MVKILYGEAQQAPIKFKVQLLKMEKDYLENSLMETGLVDVEKIISHRFPLSKIHEAVAIMESSE